ncbi:calcium-binding protein 39 [Blastocystis sp. subtype 4]|uniref:calcium-binding protein 39 n=1 Tax=Blastocystis sp. subtype 4 TaxID=944170 RepID=UPI000711B2E0|nr:calcium-binding protein 39 [Blastocystis sp. subtype 4]KNB45626.1 calcium-binding protein 39 [Blastocystis sp. subtype 4]|eukprot:XP_014529068.1 calcium-binding protein 39 [Blastocystis sp. subtype 4]
MEFIKRVLGYHKTPPVLVDACLFELNCIIHQIVPKYGRRLNKRFWQMKNFLFGKGGREPNLDECEELAKEIINKHVVIQILLAFPKLNFEVYILRKNKKQERKSFTQVFCTLLYRDHYKFASDYMVSIEGSDILLCIMNAYGDQSLTVNAGLMLRECIRIRCIHDKLLSDPRLIEPLFTKYVYNENFDVSSDAFQTIRDLLRKNKQLVSSKLQPGGVLFNELFGWYRELMQSSNYIINRVMVKLLSEFLLDKINFDIMIAFIGNAENLKVIMDLLCSSYETIQFDAFNVFKIFVANPDKTTPVETILRMNKNGLLEFFSTFLPNKGTNVDEL